MSLKNLRILDLSSGTAPQLATMHLADQGAQVLHMTCSPPPLRQRDITHRHKVLHVPSSRSELLSTIERVLPGIDVIIEDHARSMLSPVALELVEQYRIIHAHMPDFFADSPHLQSDRPLSHGALEAFMGLYEVPLGRSPVAHHLSLIDVTSAASLTCAILAALFERSRSGHATTVELARSEIAYPLLELNAMFTSKPPAAWNTLTWAATPFIAPYRCKDDRFLYLHVGLSHHLARFLDCLRALEPGHHRALRDALSTQTLADPTSLESMIEHHFVLGAMERLFLDRTAAQWEEILSTHGLCAVRARTLEQWCAPDGHAVLTGQVYESHRSQPGALTHTPGPAARSNHAPPLDPEPVTLLQDVEAVIERFGTPRDTPLPDPVHKPSPGKPLAGVKVLDLTHVIAGPTSTRQLAEFGADVLRVENPHFDAPWVEAFHIAYNAGKRSVTLDLQTAAGRDSLEELLKTYKPDIIALNLRPHAGASSGLDEATIREHCPDVIYAHMTAYGDHGPWGDRPGWEQTAQAVTGVQLDWGADRGVPDLFPLPFHDLCTGLHGTQAMLLALLARADEQPRDLRVTTSLVQTSLWMQWRVLGGLAPRQQGQSSCGEDGLRRFYRTRDGWGYLVVHNLEALYAVEGLERLQGAQGAALTMSLEAELAAHSFTTWTRRFRQAGLGSDEVSWVPRRTQRQVLTDPSARAVKLVHRRFHQGVGPVTETGSPIKLDGRRLSLASAPVREHASTQRSMMGRVPWLMKQARGALAIGLTKRRK